MRWLDLKVETFKNREMMNKSTDDKNSMNAQLAYDRLLCGVDLEAMNLHERRAFEKTRPHKCNECGEIFTGWTSDNFTNDYLTCFCPKCGNKNYYSYWGYCHHNAT